MSLNADFGEMEAAAHDLRAIWANLSEGNALAAAPTTGILPAGVDEVSTAITALFNTHGLAYQQLAAAAEKFHQQFVQNLSQAASTYAAAEQSAAQTLRNAVTAMEQPFDPMFDAGAAPPTDVTAPTVPSNSTVGLILGSTDYPFSVPLLSEIPGLYMKGLDSYSLLYTPEQFWPLTPQLGGLTIDQSIHQGAVLLGQAINTQLAAGNHVTVYGSSQGAEVITQEIRSLIASGSPNTGQLSFVLTGDGNNPDGGILERFTGLYIPGIDVLFNGATPANSPYTTTIYTNQYDGFADFPRYPLNLISDLNAVMGVSGSYSQHDYVGVRTYYQLPTSPGYTGDTTYYMSLDNTVPLLNPLRSAGSFGNAVADLLQPDLRVIVDMGYGSGDYANLPTPASLLEIPDPFTIFPDLAKGVVQGIDAAGVDLHLLPHSMYPTTYPFMPELNPGLNFPLPQTSATGIRH